MKSLYLFVLLAATVVAAQSCTPGSTFKLDCNTCFCGEDGKTIGCTIKACIKLDNENPDVMLVDTRVTKQVCTPLSKFKDYCNDCFCAKDGLSYSCTRMACDKTLWNRDGSRNIDSVSRGIVPSTPEQVCTPQMKFKDYCNDCFCAADGLSYSCTRMACDTTIWNRDGTLKIDHVSSDLVQTTPKQICKPGVPFKKYCNDCACADDGSTYACTRKMCDESMWSEDGALQYIPKSDDTIKEGKKCEPGKIFSPDGCNTCMCNKNGTTAFCTLKLCVKLVDNSN